ncbi:hypothetical protein Dimus_026893 [Dionaea muscipula]
MYQNQFTICSKRYEAADAGLAGDRGHWAEHGRSATAPVRSATWTTGVAHQGGLAAAEDGGGLLGGCWLRRICEAARLTAAAVDTDLNRDGSGGGRGLSWVVDGGEVWAAVDGGARGVDSRLTW